MDTRELIGNHQGFIGARRISNCFKDRDEELSFFRDLQKREKDVTLLQPDSDEFEANGMQCMQLCSLILINKHNILYCDSFFCDFRQLWILQKRSRARFSC